MIRAVSIKQHISSITVYNTCTFNLCFIQCVLTLLNVLHLWRKFNSQCHFIHMPIKCSGITAVFRREYFTLSNMTKQLGAKC